MLGDLSWGTLVRTSLYSKVSVVGSVADNASQAILKNDVRMKILDF